MDERRGEGRVRTFLRGRIAYNNRAATLDCLVRDLSTTGARLALEDGAGLPEHFDLAIPQREMTVRCQLRWRRPGEVGVVFVVPASAGPRASLADPAAVDLLLRVRRLELENEELRRRLAGAAVPALEPA